MSKEPNQFSAFSLLTMDALPEGIKEVDPNEIIETDEPLLDDDKGDDKGEGDKTPKSDDNAPIVKNKSSLNDDDKGDDDPNKNKGNEGDDDDESPIVTFAKILDEKGVIDLDIENFEDSEDGLIKAVETTVEKRINDYKASLGERALQLVEYIENGGKLERFVEIAAQKDYSDVTEDELKENVQLQKMVITDQLKAEKYSEEEIEQELADYEDAGILFSKSKRALNRVTAIRAEQTQQEVEAQKEFAKQQQLHYQKWLSDLEADITSREEIAGFKVPEKQKKDFFKYITEPVRVKVKDANGKEVWANKTRMMIDSEKDKDAQLKMAWLYYNNFDFSKVEKQAVKQVASKLKDQLSRNKDEGKNLTTAKRTRAPEDVTGDFSLFKKRFN